MRKLALLALLLGCASGPQPTPTESEADAAPGLRLSRYATPTLIQLQLTIDPHSEKLSGVADIDVSLSKPTRTVWVNAGEMTVTRAEVWVGDAHQAANLLHTDEAIGLSLSEALSAPKVRLHIEYQASISSRDNDGVFRESVGDDWFVFSHFEPFHARRAFPCFDEPGFKPAWQMTLRVPKGEAAFNNSPLVERTDDPDGMQTYRFAPTPPLPSYLVSLAVGPLVRVDGGTVGKGSIPFGVIVPRGQEEQAAYPLKLAPRVITYLEDYFGSPCPYPKLDLVSIPLYGGATENPGLVVFAQRIFLSKPKDQTIAYRRIAASVIAHELSHLWVGDLVTNAWWDDVWLNEAFATWMADKVLESLEPSWGTAETRVQSRERAMGADSLLTARQIRQAITSKHDIKNAFDGITYTKGAAVLSMFESYLGPPTFQASVQRYLAAHANGTATTADFLSALGQGMAGPFNTFLDQPGIPVVDVKLSCEGPKPSLALTQRRYLPAGAELDGSPSATPSSQVWQVPFCVRWGARGAIGRDCTLLIEASQVLPLSAASCPDWVLPNAGAAGYYRSSVTGDALGKLLAASTPLTASEQLGVLGDADAQVRAGTLPLDELLRHVTYLASSENRFIAEDAIGVVTLLRDRDLVRADEKEVFAKFAGRTFGPHFAKLGWNSSPGEAEDSKLLRTDLIGVMGDLAEDPGVIAEARKRADAWLADHASIDPDQAGAVLTVAAAHGDQALFDRWHQAARAEKDQRSRMRLLNAMSSFRDPAIVKQALALVVSGEFEIRESIALLQGSTREPANRPLAWEFVQQSFDGLAAKMPRDTPAWLPWLAEPLCDDARRDEIEGFFRDRSTSFAGGPRQLAQAMESMHQCAVFRRNQAQRVDAFLVEFIEVVGPKR